MTSTPLTPPVPDPASILPRTPAVLPSPPKVKLADPKKFTGKAGNVEKFIRTIDSHFHIRSYASYTDYEKVQVFASFLASPADDWHDAISTSRPTLLNSYNAFRSHYESATHQQDLLGKLDKLCQVGTATDYVARFVALADQAGIDDVTRREKFFHGLKAEVRHGLSLQVLPTAPFEQITQHAISVDYALAYNARVPLHPGLKGKNGAMYTPSTQYPARSSQNSNGNGNSRPPAPSSSSSTPTPSSGPWPMEIDSVHSRLVKGKLPKEELERRIKNNLCLYCGLSGHAKDSCPTKSDKSKLGKDTPHV